MASFHHHNEDSVHINAVDNWTNAIIRFSQPQKESRGCSGGAYGSPVSLLALFSLNLLHLSVFFFFLNYFDERSDGSMISHIDGPVGASEAV
jgi:hypothetical protein